MIRASSPKRETSPTSFGEQAVIAMIEDRWIVDKEWWMMGSEITERFEVRKQLSFRSYPMTR